MRFSRCALLQLLAATASTTSVAAEDPSLSPSSTAPVLLSKGDKTPSEVPSMDPSALPSKDPSAVPSIDPSARPTESMGPSESPSSDPSQSINPSNTPTTNPSSSMSPTRDFEEIDGYDFIGYGHCLDADGHKYNSISVTDKYTGKSSECGQGCGGCFWNIPEYVGINYFYDGSSNKCSCLFDSSITKDGVKASTTCSGFTDEAFDFENSGQGQIVASDSITDVKRDYRTCYSRHFEEPSDFPTMNPSSSLSPTSEAEKKKIFNYTGTIQYFTAPKTAVYTFTAVGAKGGDCNGCRKSTCKYICENLPDGNKPNACDQGYNADWCYSCAAQYNEGGYGALVRGKFLLRKGDKVKVVVGGKGEDCKALPRAFNHNMKLPLPDGRNYLEARTGAGGGGATSVMVQYDDGQEDLLLVVGGGGGAAYFFPGEDGEAGPNGGFGWGGRNGKGGGLGPVPATGHNDIPAKPQFKGAGGGGVNGNGDSRYARFFQDGLRLKKDNENFEEVVWAEGGFSLSNGSRGGFVDRHELKSDENKHIEAQSGSAGGYGGGGEGGAGETYWYGSSNNHNEYNGSGGGGGGYGGGGAGLTRGDGAGGGGSFFADDLTTSIERHQGDSDGQFIIQMEEDVDTYYYAYAGRKETFDVPEEGDYELIAVGGRGGSCNNNSGGYGAQASGIFRLSKGDQLHIAVGGKGGDCKYDYQKDLSGNIYYFYSGAGGAGGTFIEWEEGTSKTRKLLLVGGGGGGAGKDLGGVDGEEGANGTPDLGGKNGNGGGLSCEDVNSCGLGFFLNGGAGGGGYEGDGRSRCGDAKKCYFGPVGSNDRQCNNNVLAAGGESFRNGGKGGQEAASGVYPGQCSNCDCIRWGYFHGGYGGFGGGGEGGVCRVKIVREGNTPEYRQEHGGGGGGGGNSGGGAGQFQGYGGGGGGTYGNAEAALSGISVDRSVGWYHGYVIIRKITGLGGPGPGGPGPGGPGPAGKSGKKDGKTGKTETEAIFT